MIVKPFRGIRPPKNLVEKVNSRPYDVLNSDEARKEAEGNEMSLYHIIPVSYTHLDVYKRQALRVRARCRKAPRPHLGAGSVLTYVT